MNSLVDGRIDPPAVPRFAVRRAYRSAGPRNLLPASASPGISENIRVTSIVGRFLEHSRIYCFQNGGEEEIYLGSADLMPRNLDRRVEVLFPVCSERLRSRLKHEVLDLYLKDNVKARRMTAAGTYVRRAAAKNERRGECAGRVDSILVIAIRAANSNPAEIAAAQASSIRAMTALKGSLWAVMLYDVSEEIDLDQVRARLAPGAAERDIALRGPAPEYVGFARRPVMLTLPPIRVDSGDEWSCVLKFYDYGVISVALQTPFESDWDGLVALSSRWVGSSTVEQCAIRIARTHVDLIRKALVKPYDGWTTEDYYVVHLRDSVDEYGSVASGQELIEQHGGKIARIVRGEASPLSDSEQIEILRTYVSYYPNDLLVVGWMAAFVYDNAEGAATALQLLEYANTQLIEFRYFDKVLTEVLAAVYRRIERRRGVWGRWRTAGEAEDLNRIRLDVTELTERVDNAIKFLSDMFYARAYRLAARKIGVNDYRDLVDEKLKTAADLYQSMVNEFHQARAFVLEAMVVAILVIELAFLFMGRG